MHAVLESDQYGWLRLTQITSHTKSCWSVGWQVDRQPADRKKPPGLRSFRNMEYDEGSRAWVGQSSPDSAVALADSEHPKLSLAAVWLD
jgi:hypothetical protein